MRCDVGGVAVVGPVTIDRIVQDGEEAHKRGGVITYAGLTFAEMGVETRVVTKLAAADGAVLEPLHQRGIEVCAATSRATTRFVNYVDGDARRQQMSAWAGAIGAEQLESALTGIELVHLGPLHPDDIGPDALAAIPGACRVGLDVQGYVRQIAGEHVDRGVSPHLCAALRRADFVKASIDELDLVLAHCGRPLQDLVEDCAIAEWVVPAGSRGGWVLERTGARTEFASPQVAEVVDPTGAGDVFFAAYMAFRHHRGQTVVDSLQWAAAQAARQVSGGFITPAILRL